MLEAGSRKLVETGCLERRAAAGPITRGRERGANSPLGFRPEEMAGARGEIARQIRGAQVRLPALVEWKRALRGPQHGALGKAKPCVLGDLQAFSDEMGLLAREHVRVELFPARNAGALEPRGRRRAPPRWKREGCSRRAQVQRTGGPAPTGHRAG